MSDKKEIKALNLQKPEITIFENPKTIRSLSFTNRLNNEYEVNDIPIDEFDLGEQKSYQDFIKLGKDPNTEKNSNMYGYAKQYKPLTQRLCDMRGSINDANLKLQAQLDKKQAEAIAAKQAEPATTPAQNSPAQGGNND